MSLGPQEIVRSELEGGLSGPANSLTAESIDCGCGQYKLPRLAKFATRRTFLSLLCCIGILQAAAQAYLHVTGATLARSLQIDPYLMEWLLCSSEIATVLLGLAVAYWGDRFHRASWLGGSALLQCASFLGLLIPHFCSVAQLIDADAANATHASVYAEQSPDLCLRSSAAGLYAPRDPPYYSALFLLIVAQSAAATANVAYYALGFSYLDDNSKRPHAPVYFAVVLAARILGCALGYSIGWAFLGIDANDLGPVSSYRAQVGAWWLGWPLFAAMLAIPSTLMAIFPRKLPSEMVEIAAASILDQSGTVRGPQRLATKRVGSPGFSPSMLRLLGNRILSFNILAGALLISGLANFAANENIFLESRFYAPRPAGTFLGFGDPLASRLVATISRPVLVGLSVVVAGLVIARAKPRARTLANYSFAVLVLSAIAVFCLAFADCQKRQGIQGIGKGELITKVCNLDCRCSRDADFRPVCDGTDTHYSPCHAGCASLRLDSAGNKLYSNCSCVGSESSDAREGACGSDGCRAGWLIYEMTSVLVYAAAASTLIGDLLTSLRSVNDQDKALAIGHGMAIIALLAYVLGKMAYDELAKSTCQFWGRDDHVCRLYHSTDLGNYLCFLTAALTLLSALLKLAAGYFCKDLEIYDPAEVAQQPRELKDMSEPQEEPLLRASDDDRAAEPAANNAAAAAAGPLVIMEREKEGGEENGPVLDAAEASGSRLEHGPGDRRADHTVTDDDDSSDGAPREASQLSDSSGVAPGIRPPFSNLPLQRRSAKKHDQPLSAASRGDFNELGIPIVESYEATLKGSVSSLRSPAIMLALQQLDHPSTTAELVGETLCRSLQQKSSVATEVEENRKFRLDSFMQPANFSPQSVRPPSRDQTSSGFGSLQDMRERARLHSDVSDSKDSLSSKSSASGPPKKGGPLCTDL